MKRQIFFFVCSFSLITFSLSGQENKKPEFKIVPIDREMPFERVSPNGKYIIGTSVPENFIYNIETEEITYLYKETESPEETAEPYWEGVDAQDVSNDGTVCGSYGPKMDAPAAIWQDGKWEFLPVPHEYSEQGSANTISPDGKFIAGYVNATGQYFPVPCLWELKEGSYQFRLLPYPEKDWNDQKPQNIVVLEMSNDGKVILGRLVDDTGFFPLPIVWTRENSGEYSYKVYGEEILFHLEKEKPGICPEQEDYITVSKDDPLYDQQVNEYNEARDKYFQLRNAYKTGNTLQCYSMSLSENGKYLTTSLDSLKTIDGEETPISYPCRFDLPTGIHHTYTSLPSGIGRYTTNDGITFAASPTYDTVRSGFLFLDGKNEPIPLEVWLKNIYDIDITPELTFDYQMVDPETQQPYWVYDKLHTGMPMGNGDMSLITATLPDPSNFTHFVNYYIRIPENASNIHKDETSPNKIYAKDHILYIEGNVEEISIIDLTGKRIYSSQITNGIINLDMLASGIYLVKTNREGITETHKIILK